MLAIEVEYLLGVVYAASVENPRAPEWPPHPDRLFSALICAWAEAGQQSDEEQALRWLEQQPPPALAAAPAGRRRVVPVLVPPNDMAVSGRLGSAIPKGKSLQRALAVLPELRTDRQPRTFPAVVPEDSRSWYIWPHAAAPEDVRAALCRVATRVGYLGHSASLVRVRVVAEASGPPEASYQPDPAGREALRWVYRGRLEDLVQGYGAAPKQGRVWRPGPGPAYAYRCLQRGGENEAPCSVFGETWWLLEHAGGSRPALTAVARVARVLRHALLGVAGRSGSEVPEALSGHGPAASPSQRPHLAVAPLADVGWEYSGGRLLGLGLILPRAIEEGRGSDERRAVLRAVAALLRDGVACLTLGRLGVWELRLQPGLAVRSLRRERYLGPARWWGSVTPVVLDRFPKPKEGHEAEAVVAEACHRVGLPRPEVVHLYKHAAVRGAPSARPPRGPPPRGPPPRGPPPRTDWTFPRASPLADRCRRHVVLGFRVGVRGPLLLGAGRYQGLGLCLPLTGM